jgi:hypothetical protein
MKEWEVKEKTHLIMRREWEVRKKKEKVRKSVKLEEQTNCRCGSLELGP